MSGLFPKDVFKQIVELVPRVICPNDSLKCLLNLSLVDKRTKMLCDHLLGKHYRHFSHLNLHHRNLSTLPNFMSKVIRLTELDLHHNDFAVIPRAILKLKCIRMLCLNHNKIQRIPPEIKQMSSLLFLNLSNNPIQTVSVQDMPRKLKKILLYNTFVSSVPKHHRIGLTIRI